RLQLQGEALKRLRNSNEKPPLLYKNSLDCIVKTFQLEGIHGLQKGLTPAILREGSKNLFRLGMYDPILRVLHPPSKYDTSPPTWKMMTSGAICGAMGALACNPFELIKTRLQSKAEGSLASIGHQHHYTGVRMALTTIYQQEGFLGWYRGSLMSVGRSMVGSSSNLSAFHVLKRVLVEKYGWKDHIFSDMVSGLVSGFASVICMNPIDVLRTRYYNQPFDPQTGQGKYYASPYHSATSLIRNEGWHAFYKGFLSHFLRIGPHFCLTFMFLGILKRAVQSQFNQEASEQVFHKFDSNRDGYLSSHDLYTLFQYYQISPPIALLEQLSFPLPVQKFQQFTLALIKSQQAQRLSCSKKWFQTLDINKDGFIDPNELSQWMNQQGITNEIPLMIKIADFDKDGQVSFQDFSKFLEKFQIQGLFENTETTFITSLQPLPLAPLLDLTYILNWWSEKATHSSSVKKAS
ncbi:Mitochondrial oxaloacetate carrier protein, partial [Coelomomyces lativittatus]